MMKRLIKAGLMVLMGIVIWINGGMVQNVDAQTGGYWEQAQQQQQQQQRQQEQINQQNQMMYSPQYACVSGRDIYGHIGDVACGGDQPNNPKPVVKKPSSYGAVAWSIQNRKLGISSRQATKQASISAAMKQCGDATCVVSATYSNSCIALGYGESKNPVKTGQYIWFAEGGLTSETKSIEKMLRICNKVAKNCQVTFSECSLP